MNALGGCVENNTTTGACYAWEGLTTLAIVRGTIVDAASGERVAARVIIRCSDGTKPGTEYAHIEGLFAHGEFSVEVPPGPTTVLVCKGPAFYPERFSFTATELRPVQLNVALERWIPYDALGWVAGETHTHMIHGERETYISFARAATMAAAEGLEYIVLGGEWNADDCSPKSLLRLAAQASTREIRVFIGNEAPKNYYRGDVSTCLGHCWTVGADLSAGQPDLYAEIAQLEAHDYESEKPPVANFELIAKLREAGAVICYTHPLRWWTGPWGGVGEFPRDERKFISNLAAELPFDTLAGPVYDGIDILMREPWDDAAQRLWFMLLNRGYRLAGTTSGDICFDRRGALGPGMKSRLYTYLGGAELSPQNLAAAIRAGKNVVSTGPFLTLAIGRGQIGDTIDPSPPEHEVVIDAWAASAQDEAITKVELLRRGETIAEWHPGEHDATVQTTVSAEPGDWFVARCWGRGEGQVAITNPIYVKSFDRPEPAMAHVEVRVVDAITGESLRARVEEIAIVGAEQRRLATHTLPIGYAELLVPITRRLRASAPGYQPQTLSLLFDVDRVREWTLGLRAEDLVREDVLDELLRLLERCRLTFRLSRA